jgi:hypothetical protein
VKRKPTALPKWVWALPIAALVLMSIVWLSPKEEYLLDTKNLTCDERFEAYLTCLNLTTNVESCKSHYVDEIINCYGESVLQDQLALSNSTVVIK